jgi:ubiquinone/menaquinone biosynthesis C-methylase UbiE
MKLCRIEKWFMNRPKHAERIIIQVERLLRFVNLNEKNSLLEVGCGNGELSKHIAGKYRLNVIGVDIDPDMVKRAQESIDGVGTVDFLAVDATKLPFPDGQFDIVLSSGVMHHISNWLDALEEINRVLKPRGYLIHKDLLFTKWVAKIGRSFKHSYGVTTLPDLNSFILKNNFNTIHSALSKSLIFNYYEAVYVRG